MWYLEGVIRIGDLLDMREKGMKDDVCPRFQLGDSGWWCLSLRCETKASGLVVVGSEHSSRTRGHPRQGVAGSVCLDLRRGV